MFLPDITDDIIEPVDIIDPIRPAFGEPKK